MSVERAQIIASLYALDYSMYRSNAWNNLSQETQCSSTPAADCAAIWDGDLSQNVTTYISGLLLHGQPITIERLEQEYLSSPGSSDDLTAAIAMVLRTGLSDVRKARLIAALYVTDLLSYQRQLREELMQQPACQEHSDVCTSIWDAGSMPVIEENLSNSAAVIALLVAAFPDLSTVAHTGSAIREAIVRNYLDIPTGDADLDQMTETLDSTFLINARNISLSPTRIQLEEGEHSFHFTMRTTAAEGFPEDIQITLEEHATWGRGFSATDAETGTDAENITFSQGSSMVSFQITLSDDFTMEERQVSIVITSPSYPACCSLLENAVTILPIVRPEPLVEPEPPVEPEVPTTPVRPPRASWIRRLDRVVDAYGEFMLAFIADYLPVSDWEWWGALEGNALVHFNLWDRGGVSLFYSGVNSIGLVAGERTTRFLNDFFGVNLFSYLGSTRLQVDLAAMIYVNCVVDVDRHKVRDEVAYLGQAAVTAAFADDRVRLTLILSLDMVGQEGGAGFQLGGIVPMGRTERWIFGYQAGFNFVSIEGEESRGDLNTSIRFAPRISGPWGHSNWALSLVFSLGAGYDFWREEFQFLGNLGVALGDLRAPNQPVLGLERF